MTPEDNISDIATNYINKPSKNRNSRYEINKYVSTLKLTTEHKLLVVLLIFSGLSHIN